MKICPKCGNQHEKPGTFCSRTCANSRIHTEETKIKIQTKLKGINKVKINLICPSCKGTFLRFKIRMYCSKQCAGVGLRARTAASKPEKEQYWRECKFRFNFFDYPNEFDINLFETVGVYNSETNANGISRDHLISVKFGYDNKINPKLISHPANCKLLRHTDNQKKNAKCAITIGELLNRIEEWDKKYNVSVV